MKLGSGLSWIPLKLCGFHGNEEHVLMFWFLFWCYLCPSILLLACCLNVSTCFVLAFDYFVSVYPAVSLIHWEVLLYHAFIQAVFSSLASVLCVVFVGFDLFIMLRITFVNFPCLFFDPCFDEDCGIHCWGWVYVLDSLHVTWIFVLDSFLKRKNWEK